MNLDGVVDSRLVAYLKEVVSANNESLPPLPRPLAAEQATALARGADVLALGKPLAQEIATAWGVSATPQQVIALLSDEEVRHLHEMRCEAVIVLTRAWPQSLLDALPDDLSQRLRAVLLQTFAEPDFLSDPVSGKMLRFVLGETFTFEAARPVMHLVAVQEDDVVLFEGDLRSARLT